MRPHGPPRPWRLALTALLMAAPLLAGAQRGVLNGTAIVVEVESLLGGPERLLGMLLDGGRRVELQTDGAAPAAAAARLVTGMRVQVAGRWGRSPTQAPCFLATTLEVTSTLLDTALGTVDTLLGTVVGTVDGLLGGLLGRRLLQAADDGAGGAPPLVTPSSNQLAAQDVSTIFIPIAAMRNFGAPCPNTDRPLSSVPAVRRAVFEERGSRGATVGGLFNRCSLGASRLDRSNSLVAPLVELPCSGTAGGVPWSFDTCGFDDFHGYALAADAVLEQSGIDLDAYAHRVYLLPPSTCGFVGLGYVGCTAGDCRSWIGADFWTSPSAIAHELGHNLFLAHAGAVTNSGVFDEYADISGLMGYCCSDRCPNTPHAWQLGWITVQQIDWTAVQPGQTVALTLISQSLSSQAGLRITGLSSSDPVFVGYRTRAGGDASATADVAGDPGGLGRLHLHTAPISGTFDPRATTWHAALDSPGQSWELADASLVVRLHAANRSAAAVALCRVAGPETLASCQAGLDNDCNGQTGAQDAACQPMLLQTAGLEAKQVRPPPARPLPQPSPPPPPRPRPSRLPPRLRRPPPPRPRPVQKPPPRRPPPRRQPPSRQPPLRRSLRPQLRDHQRP